MTEGEFEASPSSYRIVSDHALVDAMRSRSQLQAVTRPSLGLWRFRRGASGVGHWAWETSTSDAGFTLRPLPRPGNPGLPLSSLAQVAVQASGGTSTTTEGQIPSDSHIMITDESPLRNIWKPIVIPASQRDLK